MRIIVAALLGLTMLFSAGCAVVDVLPEPKRSAHFVATAKHLDLGGQVYLYADLSGDLERITAFISNMFEELKKENPDPELARIDIEKLVTLLGFNKVQAVGLSSYKDGEIYRNKGFIYHPGPKEGLMILAGDKARPFEIANWAPADADLVFEQDYNFNRGFQTFEAILRQAVGGEADEILADLNKPLPKMHVNLRQIIEKLDSRMVGVIRIHEKQLISIPNEDLEFPYTEIAIGIDGLGFVFDDLVESFGGLPMIKVSAADDYHSIEIAKPLPGPLSLYQPVLAKDVKSGRVYFASSLALLKEFVPGPKALGKSKVFLKATGGFPKSGNGLTFVSDKFVAKMMTWLTKMSSKNQEIEEMMSIIQALMPEKDIALASCNGMLPDGMFFVSNSHMSHKATIMAMGYTNPMVIGMLAAVAIPAFIGYRREAEAAGMTEYPAAVPAKPVPAPPAVLGSDGKSKDAKPSTTKLKVKVIE